MSSYESLLDAVTSDPARLYVANETLGKLVDVVAVLAENEDDVAAGVARAQYERLRCLIIETLDESLRPDSGEMMPSLEADAALPEVFFAASMSAAWLGALMESPGFCAQQELAAIAVSKARRESERSMAELRDVLAPDMSGNYI